MLDITKHPLFRKWEDPVTGVPSYLLRDKPAPLTQGFYFINSSLTENGRYLWFYCGFPPSGDAYHGRCLGNVDLEENRVSCFPETQFGDASPLIDTVTGEAYWTSGSGIFRRGPGSRDPVERVAEIPNEIIQNRTPRRIATHLTLSADRSSLNIDIEVGREWIIGDVSLETGRFTLWQEMDICYNHGQFSPIDPDLQMIAQDWWYDCLTGERTFFKNRIWLLRRGQKAVPVYEGIHDTHCHEWWAADGRKILYVDYETGTYSYELATGETRLIWPGKPCHSHCTADQRYFVGDVNDYTWKTDPCKVLFYDPQTGREIAIVSDMAKLRLERSWYHIDPHPRFVLGDQYIVYTSSEDAPCTVALTRVEDVLSRLEE